MIIDELKFNDQGLIPAIIQDEGDKRILMLAYMNRESLQMTLQTRKCTYFSRSRQKLWLKGETSGHIQHVKSIYYDCDEDTLLICIRQEGVACHTGERSCFYRQITLDE